MLLPLLFLNNLNIIAQESDQGFNDESTLTTTSHYDLSDEKDRQLKTDLKNGEINDGTEQDQYPSDQNKVIRFRFPIPYP
jgi:hypothetical protein